MAESRRLAAIMFTDIVGSTTIMQHNEIQAVTNAKKYTLVLKQSVAEYSGEILNDYGDGSLCIFSSIIQALHSAIEIQFKLQAEPVIPLRIGLHIGEIFFDEGKIFGDGVNIASRIQSLGLGNSILFSKEVYDKIKNQAIFKAVSLGNFEFKNVDEPIEVFALANEGLVVPRRKQLEGKLKKKKVLKRNMIVAGLFAILMAAVLSYLIFFRTSSKAADHKISIAIIPFRNQTTNQDFDSYCYGLASEIRTQLSLNNQFEFISSDQATNRYKDSKLSPAEMGNELGVDYLLLGSIYELGNKMKITVELADGKSNKSIWSIPPYLTPLSSMEDLFSVQTSIAKKVLDKFSMEKKYSPSIPTTSLPAYNYYLKARESLGRLDMKLSIEFFEKAIQLDSNFLSAYQGLIFAKAYVFWNFGQDTVKREKELKPYTNYIDKKFPNSWETYLAKGSYYYHGLKNFQLGLEFCQKAFLINPNSDDACHLIGGINRRRLNSKEALYYNQKSRDANPSNPTVWHELSIILSDNGNLSEALESETISKNLGMNEEFVNDMILGIAKENGTMAKFPDKLKEYFGIKFQAFLAKDKRDWKEVLRIANSSEQNKAYSALERIIDKTYAFYFLGQIDSAKLYAALAQKNEDANKLNYKIEDMVAIEAGNKKAVDYFYEVIEKKYSDHSGQDLSQICENTKALISLMAFIGEHKQAVVLLIDMNRKYAGYGNYHSLYTDFHFDRIKKEYPPFNEALKNLKLPPKFDVSDIFKKFKAS